MIRVEYIWHDGFLVETEAAMLLFDYWHDRDGDADMPECLQNSNSDKPLYVFVSHGHKDHYNPTIFSWASEFKSIHYIVSTDVWRRIRHIAGGKSAYNGPKVDPDCVTRLQRGESYVDERLKIVALPSTDIGNSYFVELAEGGRIFHAGDLNLWLFDSERGTSEERMKLGTYKKYLEEISRVMPRVDYCFFPIDSRIGGEYWRGAEMFLNKIKVDKLYPMHFGLGDIEEQSKRKADALKSLPHLAPLCKEIDLIS